jgi:hypothetical protein
LQRHLSPPLPHPLLLSLVFSLNTLWRRGPALSELGLGRSAAQKRLLSDSFHIPDNTTALQNTLASISTSINFVTRSSTTSTPPRTHLTTTPPRAEEANQLNGICSGCEALACYTENLQSDHNAERRHCTTHTRLRKSIKQNSPLHTHTNKSACALSDWLGTTGIS